MTRAAALAWLAARAPARPAALAAEMTRLIGECPDASFAAAGTMADAMGALGLFVLGGVAAGGPASPELALALLAADAFVTYTFEAGAEEGVAIHTLAHHLLHEAA